MTFCVQIFEHLMAFSVQIFKSEVLMDGFCDVCGTKGKTEYHDDAEMNLCPECSIEADDWDWDS
jgi:hypothetical protein